MMLNGLPGKTIWPTLIFLFFLSSCGGGDTTPGTQGGTSLDSSAGKVNQATDPFSNGTTPPPTDNATSCNLECCKNLMKGIDTDGDGVNDYDEVYGRSIHYLGQDVKVYTDPFNVRTRGDGIGAGDAELQSNRIDGNGNITLSAPVTRNPALRDFVVRVYARGGINSQESPTNDVGWVNFPDGWNAYPNLSITVGSQVKIQELNPTSDVWSESYGSHVHSLNARGITGRSLRSFGQANCNSAAAPNICLPLDLKGSLIGKYSASPSDLISAGDTPFSIGSLMDSTNFVTAIAFPASNSYLMLRENDYRGRGSLADNHGYITVLVSVTDRNVYPQQAPSGDGEKVLLKKICSGPKYPQQVLSF